MKRFASLNLIGNSAIFQDALRLILRFSACDATVLILGETGTGKELAARAIHYLSARRDGPFIPVNCGAVPDSLVESEFFGHVKGAFTDAREARRGLVMQAKGGTLFLDEIEALSPRAQGVLLRFLQDREYRPVGGAVVQNANVRVVAACNVKIFNLVRQGLFRADLVFRLNTLALELPPLRERIGDITLLAQEFLARLNHQAGPPYKVFHPACIAMLEAYDWPGNVRELENFLHKEFILADGAVIKIGDPARETRLLFSQMDAGAETGSKDNLNGGTGNAGWRERRSKERRCTGFNRQADGGNRHFQFNAETPHGHPSFSYEDFKKVKKSLIAELEKKHLIALLTQVKGNMSLASRLSGRDRSDLCKLLKRHGIERQHFCADLPGMNPEGGEAYDSAAFFSAATAPVRAEPVPPKADPDD